MCIRDRLIAVFRALGLGRFAFFELLRIALGNRIGRIGVRTAGVPLRLAAEADLWLLGVRAVRIALRLAAEPDLRLFSVRAIGIAR